MDRTFAILGAVFMVLGVAAGSFGAHALEGFFDKTPAMESTYRTAVRYHLIHALGLFAVAWAASRWPGSLTNAAGVLIIIGILLFSGSLYLLTLTGMEWLGAITPIGGAAFIGGWIFLAAAAWRR